MQKNNLNEQEKRLFDEKMKNRRKEIRPKVLITLLLWLFLGGLGAHRFYLGKKKTAVLMLLFGVTTIFINLLYPDKMESELMADILMGWILIDGVILTLYFIKLNQTLEQEVLAEIQAAKEKSI